MPPLKPRFPTGLRAAVTAQPLCWSRADPLEPGTDGSRPEFPPRDQLASRRSYGGHVIASRR
jgi:hypothetical protein